jgi:rSAM/selenodomain-associated transferase 2
MTVNLDLPDRYSRPVCAVVKLRRAEHPPRVSARTLSVVIPVLEERDAIESVLAATKAPCVERIVVDGGSSDGTAERALLLGAERVVSSPRGRALQLQAGYEVAHGDAILFHHADTRLEAGWDRAVRGALEDPRVAGGAFRLRFDSPRPLYRWMEEGVRLRCLLGRLPYGDQALFARRAVLDAAGGIAPVPIFEDLDLVLTIRRAGRLALLPVGAWTSPRRYERNGPVSTVLRNNVALMAWLLDLDRAAVATWYRRRPRR